MIKRSTLMSLMSVNQPSGSDKYISTQEDWDNLVINDNDNIYLEKGKTFLGGKIANASNVTMTNYGSGNMPIVKGSVDISGLSWSDQGGNIWSAPLNTEPLWIFIDDVVAKQAQYPQPNQASIQILSSSAANKVTIDPDDVSGFTNIIGSQTLHKLIHFRYGRRHTITDYNASTGEITLSEDTIAWSAYDGGTTLELFNDIEYFNNNNEWVWRGNTIYVKSATDPSGRNIRMTDEEVGLTFNGNNNSVNGIEITQFFNNGIRRTGGENFLVNGCKIHALRGIGLMTNSLQINGTFSQNEIYDVKCGIHDYMTSELICEYNTIYDCGLQANHSSQMSPYPDLVDLYPIVEDCGIAIKDWDASNVPDGQHIRYNNIYNIAYNCLKVKGINNKIYGNILDSGMQDSADGGWIYANGTGNFSTWFEYNEIYNNIFKGSNNNAGSKVMYFDLLTRYNNFHHNVIDVTLQNTSTGLLSGAVHADNDNYQNTYEDNIIISNNVNCSKFRSLNNSYSQSSNNVWNRNIVATRASNGYLLEFINLKAGTQLPFVTADNNYYINPYQSKLLNSDDFGDLALSGIQSNYGLEANSVEKYFGHTYVDQTTAEEDVKLYINETDSNYTIVAPSGYEDEAGNDVSGQTLTVYARQNGTPGLVIFKS